MEVGKLEGLARTASSSSSRLGIRLRAKFPQNFARERRKIGGVYTRNRVNLAPRRSSRIFLYLFVGAKEENRDSNSCVA